jgi:hypothetical protein
VGIATGAGRGGCVRPVSGVVVERLERVSHRRWGECGLRHRGLGSTRFDYPADCFTTGNLSTHEVPCLTASHQRLLTPAAPRTQDVHDLQLLDTLEQATPNDPAPWEPSR